MATPWDFSQDLGNFGGKGMGCACTKGLFGKRLLYSISHSWDPLNTVGTSPNCVKACPNCVKTGPNCVRTILTHLGPVLTQLGPPLHSWDKP